MQTNSLIKQLEEGDHILLNSSDRHLISRRDKRNEKSGRKQPGVQPRSKNRPYPIPVRVY